MKFKVHIVVELPSSLASIHRAIPNSICFEQKSPLFWIDLFCSGGIYSVLTDNWRNTTCLCGHELSHGSTDLSTGCWDSSVRAALAAEVALSLTRTGLSRAQISWFRQQMEKHFSCLECYYRKIRKMPAPTHTKKALHAFITCVA